MYAQVALIEQYNVLLIYHVPIPLKTVIKKGDLVTVPLKNKIKKALVINLCNKVDQQNKQFSIRDILTIDHFPSHEQFSQYFEQLSKYYGIPVLSLYYRMMKSFSEKNIKNSVLADHAPLPITEEASETLTTEQQSIFDSIKPSIGAKQCIPIVLQGVTGSGKTSIYKKLFLTAYEQGLSSLFLLPEVTLATYFCNLLSKEWGAHKAIFGLHAAASKNERKKLWEQLQTGSPMIIVGVHLPVFLPIEKLGIIIIDEEHDIGFQEKQHPRMHTKDVALLRAHIEKIPIILGSATPSITTMYNVHNRNWKLFCLKKRFCGSFPHVRSVSLLEDKNRRNFWISTPLDIEIGKRLERKEQVIIFLNRRGFSLFLQCFRCSFVLNCLECSVSLTYHQDEKTSLICHYCGYQSPIPNTCPSCKTSGKNFLKKGAGTQQIVAHLQLLYPTAVVTRADMDIIKNQKRWEKIRTEFLSGNIDILVGTQTITKGYHFPKVSLVGILWADANLHMPQYHAAETTLQQIIQVAGRSGRNKNQIQSEVIIQFFTQHPLFSYVNELQYPLFYDYEIEFRKLLSYPPFGRMALIEMRFSEEKIVEEESSYVATLLQKMIDEKYHQVKILGPSRPCIAKIKGIYIRLMYLKGTNAYDFVSLYQYIITHTNQFKSKIIFQQNPL